MEALFSVKSNNMKTKKYIFFLIILTLFYQPFAIAKRKSPELGTTNEYFSQNKMFSLQVKILGHPDRSPSECTFKKSNVILWEKKLITTPGLVDISNTGEYFVFINWGWYDEGGFKSISFYNQSGDLLKIIFFGSGNKNDMRWLRKTNISKDGNYYIIADRYKSKSQISLYSVLEQNLVWDRMVGFDQIDNILISDNGEFILVSTFDFINHNLEILYLNNNGDILWNITIDKGYSSKKKIIWLNEDGLNFKIYNQNLNKWFYFQNQENKINRTIK